MPRARKFLGASVQLRVFRISARLLCAFCCSAFVVGGMGCRTTVKESSSAYSISDRKPSSVVDGELKKLLDEIRTYPKRHDLHYRVAGIHFQRGEYRPAVEYLKEALRLAPDEPKYHFRLGQTYFRMHELDLAERELREAIRLWPPKRYSGPHAFLGYVLSLKRDHTGAIAEFKKCIETDPGNPEFYYALGAQYDIVGDKEQAARCFHEYLLKGGTTYRKNAVFLLRKLGAEVPEEALGDSSPREMREQS